MVTRSLDMFLDEQFSDDFLTDELRRVFRDAKGVIEFDVAPIYVAVDCELKVISKSFILQRFDRGFGNCFTALLAVGGIDSFEHGIIKPTHCFAVLWYSFQRKLITIDFSKEYPD